jgi:hypothetical protein
MKRKLNKYEQLLYNGMLSPSKVAYLKTLSKSEAYIYANKAGYHWFKGRWVYLKYPYLSGTIQGYKGSISSLFF